MTKVKICGIRTLQDALVAAGTGADFIGLVFVPNRRRRVEVTAAAEIVAGIRKIGRARPKVVGLFADQPLDDVNQTIESCNLDMVQLCGAEPLEYCGQAEVQVIKVLHVAGAPRTVAARLDMVDALSGQIRAYRDAGHLVTLDSAVEGLQGGTGQRFDWGIASQLADESHSFLLAGGLTPADVAEAVAEVQPWGVDVSSGVETDGMKDARKIRDFIRNASGKPA